MMKEQTKAFLEISEVIKHLMQSLDEVKLLAKQNDNGTTAGGTASNSDTDK